jgi:predicted small secreted protein
MNAMKAVARLVAVAMVLALIGTGFSGCNTVRGAGRDIQKGGQVVEKAATKTARGTKKAVHRRHH